MDFFVPVEQFVAFTCSNEVLCIRFKLVLSFLNASLEAKSIKCLQSAKSSRCQSTVRCSIYCDKLSSSSLPYSSIEQHFVLEYVLICNRQKSTQYTRKFGLGITQRHFKIMCRYVPECLNWQFVDVHIFACKKTFCCLLFCLRRFPLLVHASFYTTVLNQYLGCKSNLIV